MICELIITVHGDKKKDTEYNNLHFIILYGQIKLDDLSLYFSAKPKFTNFPYPESF